MTLEALNEFVRDMRTALENLPSRKTVFVRRTVCTVRTVLRGYAGEESGDESDRHYRAAGSYRETLY